MAKRQLPSPEVLRQLVRYDALTGKLFWLERKGGTRADAVFNTRFAGREAITGSTTDGYRQGKIIGYSVRAHRLAWAIAHGEWPQFQIDHLNGNRSDNRLANLRQVTNAENMQNQFRSPRNTSGATGVRKCARTGKWRAEIKTSGKRHSLGYFEDFGAAVAARKDAERRFGFSARHGAVAMQPGQPTF